jgi:allantoin racemase
MLMALMLGNRFSIVAMWPHWRHLYDKHLKELGLSHACASIRSIDVAPDNQALLGGKEDVVFPLLLDCARACIDQDGAEVILLGSTTMHQAHGYLAERLEVPVINPGPLAEAVLGLNLSHSRKAYPPSPAPKRGTIHAMADATERGGDDGTR